MASAPILGIDLGTTNSVVAIADGKQARVLEDAEGHRMLPSVVSFRPDGRILVGYEARARRLMDARNTVYAVKRLIGRPYDSPEVARAQARFAFEVVPNPHGVAVVQVDRGTFALAEISAMVLRQLKKTAEAALDMPCERAVVTVPANFNELQRSATRAAGQVAGLEIVRILNEPTAAALAYGHDRRSRERIAVYDLGGGTFDITILELERDVFEVLSTAGDTFLGGEDLDVAVAEVMSDACLERHLWDPRSDSQAFERLKAAGEWLKCQLSTELSADLTVEDLATERRRPVNLSFTMSRQSLEALARPWIERTLEVCEEAIGEAKLEVGDLDRVVLVGGSTRLPLCRELVAKFFGKAPLTEHDPDLVVGLGAAIHGYALSGPGVKVPRPRRPKRNTSLGIPRKPKSEIPRQPAFAPPPLPPPQRRAAVPRPPPIPSRQPRPISSRPPPAVPVRKAQLVAVETPKSELDMELDGLAPPDTAFGNASLTEITDPFSDILPTPDMAGPEEPRRRGVRSKRPTLELSVDRRAEDAPRPPTLPSAATEATTDALRSAPQPPPALPPSPPPEPLREPGPVAMASPPSPTTTPAPWPEASEPPVAATVKLAAPIAIAMTPQAPPLLMDVTPFSLGVELAGGWCRRLIARNAPVPTEQIRLFTTAQDLQREVAVRICQGEDRSFDKNQVLGEVVLSGLPPRPRGQIQIEVAFILDASGVLDVGAKDVHTGQEQGVRIDLKGGLSPEEIASMRQRLLEQPMGP